MSAATPYIANTGNIHGCVATSGTVVVVVIPSKPHTPTAGTVTVVVEAARMPPVMTAPVGCDTDVRWIKEDTCSVRNRPVEQNTDRHSELQLRA